MNFYYLDIHKRLDSSRHHVHWITSKPDSRSQGKVQSQKSSIFIQMIFNYVSLNSLHHNIYVKAGSQFNSCGKFLEFESYLFIISNSWNNE